MLDWLKRRSVVPGLGALDSARAFENVPGSDKAGADVSQGVRLSESVYPKGRCTMIINEGRRDEEYLGKDVPNVLTNGGKDAFHNALYVNPTATIAPFNYIAVSTQTGTPAATVTTLTGEVSTNGLNRAQAGTSGQDTRSHTNGQNTSTLRHQFTATGAVSGIRVSGLFNAASLGTLSHAAVMDNSRTVADQDTLTVTWTLTLG